MNLVPVSTLSFVVNNYSNEMHLAIGKGSGSFEVWKCEISTRKFEQVASTNAHDQVVSLHSFAINLLLNAIYGSDLLICICQSLLGYGFSLVI